MARYKKAEEIKVGVIGYGGAFNMGKLHLELCQKAGMAPTAVCEIDESRLAVARTDFPGIETYSTVKELLKKSAANLIIIITPHNTHAELAISCLKAGRHVVCEKPLAITTDECDAMIKAAKKSGVVLTTYHNRHWDGAILEAMERIGKGEIGEVVRVECRMGGWNKPRDWWRSSKKISGGILYDWGVHLLEYSLQVIGSEIEEVSGFAKKGFWAQQSKWGADTIEDEGYAVVRFKSGQWLNLFISGIDSFRKDGCWEATGTQGSFIMDNPNAYRVVTHKGEETVTVCGKRDSRWDLYYQNIADHLTKGAKLVITPEWSRRPIHIIDLAGRSAAAGKTLKAKYG